jgi:hypothetical protein
MDRSLGSLVVGVVALGLIIAGACKNNANDVAACRTIEDALCARAPSCGVDIGPDGTPKHSTVLTSVEACQQFYEIACLHGLQTSVTPTSTEVQACADAIATQIDGCDGGAIITDPQDVAANGACAWLIPPTTVVASTDAAATEASTTTDASADTESADSGLIIVSP